jgi:hypothetical protein
LVVEAVKPLNVGEPEALEKVDLAGDWLACPFKDMY